MLILANECKATPYLAVRQPNFYSLGTTGDLTEPYYYARKNLDVEINDNCNANESAIFQYNGKFWIVLNIRCKKNQYV
jgi:hypothetical protein